MECFLVLQLTDHGPFSDLVSLKGRPGHLSVFILYLISNSDPAPLVSPPSQQLSFLVSRVKFCVKQCCCCFQFFYLVTEQYLQAKKDDLRKWAYEIYSTFLHEKAVSYSLPPRHTAVALQSCS